MPAKLSLPDRPSLDWLRKHSKRALLEMRRHKKSTTLACAQLEVARRYGFASWKRLKTHVDSVASQPQQSKLGDGCSG